MSDNFDAAAATGHLLRHFDATMSDSLKMRAERVEKMNRVYIGYRKRDEKFKAFLEEMIVNARASLRGHGSKERAYYVLGESGSGKSTMIEHFLKKTPEFQRFEVPGGDWMTPIISFEAPKPCNPVKLAVKAANELKFELTGTDETKLFMRLNERLAANATLFMHIDEAQHAKRFKTDFDIGRVQDNLKSTLQVKGWPVHILFSGMPDLQDLIDSEQMTNRANILELPSLTLADDGAEMKEIMLRIVTRHAELQPDDIESDVFIHRLMRAVGYQYGSVIQLVRLACTGAIAENSGVIGIEHFERAYQKNNACKPEHNFFVTENWMELRPGKLRQENAEANEDRPKKRRRK